MSFLAGIMDGFADARIDKKREAERQTLLTALDKIGVGYGMGVDAPAQSASGADWSTGMGKPSGSGVKGDGTLFGLIDATEGGGNYNTLFGNSENGGAFKGVKVSDMTLAQLYDFTDPNGAYGQWVKSKVGRVATPLGRHQIVGSTLRAAADRMGLSPDTKFTPQIQNAIAYDLARGRLAPETTMAGKMAALRQEWEGFRNVPDDELSQAIINFEQGGGVLAPRPLGVGRPV